MNSAELVWLREAGWSSGKYQRLRQLARPQFEPQPYDTEPVT